MAFKDKTKNRNPFNKNKTIDALHFDIINKFEKKRKNLGNYYHNLDLLNKKIVCLKTELDKESNFINNFPLQRKIWRLEDERDKIKEEITNIETKKEEKDYLIETGMLLSHYYKTKDHDEKTEKLEMFKNKSKTEKKKTPKKDVLSWLEKEGSIYNKKKINPKNGKVILKKQVEPEPDKKEKKHLKLKNAYELLTKKELYSKYLQSLDKNYSDEKTLFYNSDICETCNSVMLLNANGGILICSNCGIQEPVILDSDKPSYKEPPKEMTSFCYKRINHLNEFLAQFQAKETTDIPEDIYNEILVEIKKERIKNMADITPEKMRVILRKIKRNDYYEHIPYIINQLNGLPPPVISSEVEDIVRNMFKEIQEPFETLRQKLFPQRKNFLSYNYVMYKFFELLELDEYLQCFQLLKSRNKLHQQDVIWKHICQHLNWEFIPSI